VPGQDSVVELFRSGHEKIEQGRVRKRKQETRDMMLTGTLIEDLITAVERAQQRAEAEEMMEMEIWFAAGEDNSSRETNFLGVA
jgi:hypothetical protein